MQTSNTNGAEPGASLAAAATGIILAIAEAIRALGTVPSGELYARMMDKLSHEQYERVISILIGAALIERSPAHVITWKGPALK